MSERHIAVRLAERTPVLYVNPPTSGLAAIRGPEKFNPGLRIIRPGLALLTPIVLPGSRRPVIVRLTEMLTRIQIRAALRRLGGRAAVRVLASDLPVYDMRSTERRVFFATDDMVAGAELMGLHLNQIKAHEVRLARESDLVVAISEPIAAKWRALGCDVAFVPNGCDAERFAETDRAPWPADVHLDGPIAGFVGQINERLDLGLLEMVAARERSVLLVGPIARKYDRRRLDVLLERQNVQWVGPKPFDAMPSYLRTMHLGLTPYADTVFNRASLPLKTIEYLAAGRAAVCTDLPAAHWLHTSHVTLARGSLDFADAVEARLEEPLTDTVVAERQEFARGHSWSKRGREFAVAIGLTP